MPPKAAAAPREVKLHFNYVGAMWHETEFGKSFIKQVIPFLSSRHDGLKISMLSVNKLLELVFKSRLRDIGFKVLFSPNFPHSAAALYIVAGGATSEGFYLEADGRPLPADPVSFVTLLEIYVEIIEKKLAEHLRERMEVMALTALLEHILHQQAVPSGGRSSTPTTARAVAAPANGAAPAQSPRTAAAASPAPTARPATPATTPYYAAAPSPRTAAPAAAGRDKNAR